MLLRALTLAQHVCITACFVALMVVLSHWHSRSEAARVASLSQKAVARGSSTFASHLLGTIGTPVRLTSAMRLKNWSAAVPLSGGLDQWTLQQANPFQEGTNASKRAWGTLRLIPRGKALGDAHEIQLLNESFASINATHSEMRLTWRADGCNDGLVCVRWLVDSTVVGLSTAGSTNATTSGTVVTRASVNATWWNASTAEGALMEQFNEDVTVVPMPTALTHNGVFQSAVLMGMCPSMLLRAWQAVVATAESRRNITAVVDPMTASDEYEHSVVLCVGGSCVQNTSSAGGAFVAALDTALGCHAVLSDTGAPVLLSASSLSTFGGVRNVTKAVVSRVDTASVVPFLTPPIGVDVLPPSVVGVLLGNDLIALSPPSSAPTWLFSDVATDIIEGLFSQQPAASDDDRLVHSRTEFQVGHQNIRVVCLSERAPFTMYATRLFHLFCIAGVCFFALMVASILLQLCLLVWPMEAIGRLIEDAPRGVLMQLLLRVRRTATATHVDTGDGVVEDDGHSMFESSMPEDRGVPLKWSFPILAFLRSWEDAVAPLTALKEADDDRLLLSHKLVCLSISGCVLNEMGGMMVGLLTLYYRLQYAKKFIPEGVLLDVDDDDAMHFGDLLSAQRFDPDEAAADIRSFATATTADAAAADSMMPSNLRTSSPNDDATMFGLVGSENPSTHETLSLGWSVSHSFGHSAHLSGQGPVGGGTPTSRRGGGGGGANQFRWVVCTALHITLPHPTQGSGLHDELSELTQLFMDVSIQAIVDMGGRIDVLQPNCIVAYFGSLRGGDQQQGPTGTEHKNPLSAMPSSVSALDQLASYHPLDQRKSPIRASVCAFMIRNQLRAATSGRARRLQSYASENIAFLMDKGSFLYGDCGNKDRLNRVVFLPEYQRMSESILGLNRHVLGAQFVATTRAARVVEGSLRRAKLLNRVASVLPIDCVEMTSDASRMGAAAPADGGDVELVSVGSSNSNSQMHYDGGRGNRHANTHTGAASLVWLFLVVELEAPHAVTTPATVAPLRQQPMLSLSYPERVAAIFHLYQMFNNAVRVGLVADSAHHHASKMDAAATGGNHHTSRRVANFASCSLRDVQKVLHHLATVKELSPLVHHLLTALEGWNADAVGMPSTPLRDGGDAKERDQATPRLRYARKQQVGWQLFGFVSLEEQHRTNVAMHAKQLREYEAAAAGGMRTVLANRRMQQQKQQLLVLPTMKPIPAAFRFAGGSASSDTAEQRTDDGCGDLRQMGSINAAAAPFSLFDVFVPTMPDPRPQLDDTTAPTPHASSSASRRQQPTAAGSNSIAHQADGVSPAAYGDPRKLGECNGTVSPMDGPLPGELPSVIRDNNNTYWERSNEVLGHGAFSAVYSGLSNDGAVVALKCISLRARHVIEADLEQEVNTACGLSHINICKYYGWVLLDAYLIVVMEYVSGGSLHAMIRQHAGGLPRSVCVTYAIGCLQGLRYLHHLGIVHCDVKPHNVLVSDDGVVKLTDFGSIVSEAKHAAPQGDDMRGTVLYMAPEVMRGGKPSAASDVFSFGLLWYEMMTGGTLPWAVVQPTLGAHQDSLNSDNAEQTIQAIAASPPRFVTLVNAGVVGIQIPTDWMQCEPQLMPVIAQCLHADPLLRPTCDALLKDTLSLNAGETRPIQ